MDINSYEALVVIETMREHGAPLSVLATATGLPESKLKYYCQREDIGICWIEVYLSILRREDTGRKFSIESLLEKETMQFCRRRNAAFWRDAERCGCIPHMVEDTPAFRLSPAESCAATAVASMAEKSGTAAKIISLSYGTATINLPSGNTAPHRPLRKKPS